MNWFISEFNIDACRLVKKYQLKNAPRVTLIYGPRGVGKSALLHYLYQQNEGESRRLITDASAFARQYAYAAQEKKLKHFRERYRSTQLLLMDDLQFLAGKVKTIEELYYTYEYIIGNGGKLVIIFEGDRPVLDFLGERLASRFLSGVTVPIKGPQEHELELFIANYIREKRLLMDKPILRLIAERTDNLGDAIKIITEFIQFAELKEDKLSLTCFQSYWDYHERQKHKKIDPVNIIQIVAQTMGVSVEELASSSRKPKVNEAREMAIYIIRTLCHISYPALGGYFKRSHNTIILSYKKMQTKLLGDQELINKYQAVLKSFKSEEA